MKISRIKSLQDLDEIVRMYLHYNDDSFMPADYKKTHANMIRSIRTGFFRIVVDDDDSLIGAMLANVTDVRHMKKKVMRQDYFFSIGGVKGYKAVVLLHEELVKEARTRKVDIVYSAGSFQDENNTFARILEKQGWQRRGYAAAFHIT
jgi:hypothetical protein